MDTLAHTTRQIIRTITIAFIATVWAVSAAQANSLSRDGVHQQDIYNLEQQLTLTHSRQQVLNDKLAKLPKHQRELREADIFRLGTFENKTNINISLALAQADVLNTSQLLDELNSDIEQTRDNLKRLTNQLQALHMNTHSAHERNRFNAQLQVKLDYLNTVLYLQQERARVLEKNKELARSIATATMIQQGEIVSAYDISQNIKREDNLRHLIQHNQQQRKHWLMKLTRLNEVLSHLESQADTQPLDLTGVKIKIFQAEEMLSLLDLDVQIAKWDDEGSEIQHALTTAQTAQLSHAILLADQLKHKVNRLQKRIINKQVIIKQQLNLLTQWQVEEDFEAHLYTKQSSILDELRADYQLRGEHLQTIAQHTHVLHHALQTKLNEVIALRQGVPGFDAHAWRLLFKHLSHLPGALWLFFKSLALQINWATTSVTLWQWGWLGAALIAWGLALKTMYYYLQAFSQKVNEASSGISVNALYVATQLVLRNTVILGLAAASWGLSLYFDIPSVNYRLLLLLLGVALVSRGLSGVARLCLLETITDHAGRDVQLYYRLKTAFFIGATITSLTLMTNELHIGTDVAELFNRLFMICVLMVSLVLIKHRRVIPELVRNAVSDQLSYVHAASKILCLFIPAALLSTAMVGLVGYVDLAWRMGYLQIIFFIVLTSYVLLRGLLVDLTDFAYEGSIKYLNHGWLLSQSIVAPLDRILRLSLFCSSIYVLFALYGWDRDPFVMKTLTAILSHPIFILFGTTITIVNIFSAIVLSTFTYWLACWSREFTYRWVFRNIRDTGLRNTLSVFTQYASVIVSLFIIARVLGVNFTALSYVLGGLAVGVGFALRDFASNVFNGMVLLMERPVRIGDFVSVGEYEGDVARIGLRAMTISSSDHLEVIVPNSQLFNRAFTNWTHHDSIIRTVIAIKVHRADDPVLVQQIIADVLATNERVLSDPTPQIFMMEMSEALIEFEVRYHINLQFHNRHETRSLVLFAIWERFKTEGIRAPYQQFDLYNVTLMPARRVCTRRC